MRSDKAEEILETLWNLSKEKKLKSIKLDDLKTNRLSNEIKELLNLKYIKLDNDKVILTEEGIQEATDVVRRHRLAERLLADVLDVKAKHLHASACQFEHLLHRGIDENICRLLGHPKVCPHGSHIPKGKCCFEKDSNGIRVISALSQMKIGEKGKIAYIVSNEKDKLDKMMAMGVLPGIGISLLQNFPSYLFKVGNSQFAVDEVIANEIFVRVENSR